MENFKTRNGTFLYKAMINKINIRKSKLYILVLGHIKNITLTFKLTFSSIYANILLNQALIGPNAINIIKTYLFQNVKNFLIERITEGDMKIAENIGFTKNIMYRK